MGSSQVGGSSLRAQAPSWELPKIDEREAASITDRDVTEARVWARQHLPDFLEGLAEAEEIRVAEVKRRRREHDLPRL